MKQIFNLDEYSDDKIYCTYAYSITYIDYKNEYCIRNDHKSYYNLEDFYPSMRDSMQDAFCLSMNNVYEITEEEYESMLMLGELKK